MPLPNPRAAAGFPGRTMCAPTWVAVARGLRLAADFPPVRRGGIHPAHGRSRRRGVPGTISGLRAGPYGLWPPKRACGRSASIVPYRVCGSVRLAFSRLAAPLCSGRAFAGTQKGGPPFAGGPSFCNNWKRRSFCALFRALIPQSRDNCARPCRGGPCRRQRRRGPGGWRKPQGRPGSRSWNPA